MVFCVERGHDIRFVLSLDLMSFNSLIESCERLQSAERAQEAWIRMAAAQAGQKDMEKLLKRITPESARPTKGAAEFLSDFGSGI